MPDQTTMTITEKTDDDAIGFVVDAFHRFAQGRTVVHLFGRLRSGETFSIADDRLQPHFFVLSSDLDKCADLAKQHRAVVAEHNATTMAGVPVARIDLRSTADQRRLAEALAANGLSTYEADINFTLQYLMHQDILGTLHISGDWLPGKGVNRHYQNPTIAKAEWDPQLILLSLDIETDHAASIVYGVSLVTDSIEEMHLVGAPAADDPDYARCYPDERLLLEGVTARIREIDPDILTGWNVVDFDLAVLQRRCKALGLRFSIGRTDSDAWYRSGATWGSSRIYVPGRQVLDGMHLVRSTVQRYEDYALETVATDMLGRGKVLGATATASRCDSITDAFNDDRRTFCEYCVEDARLVRDILEHEGLITLSIRRTLLTGLPLDRAGGSVVPFEFLYTRELHRLGMVAPTLGVDQDPPGGAPGGLVMPATAGLFNHIFVLDFRSLYPTIIRTFNLDPLAHVQARTANDAIEAPNGALFDRAPGLLPMLLERFFESRAQAREEGNKVAAYAYKIIMNSFYGCLGTPLCRFAATELSGAITGFGHHLLRWVRTWLEAQNYKVLYGDTDSLFVDAGLAADTEAEVAMAFGRELCVTVNEVISRYVRDEYNVPSHLELEFEKCYERFLVPQRRGQTEQGRAKGYAGMRITAAEPALEIIGMEAVRSDWTELAHDMQTQLLTMAFSNASHEDLDTYVSDLVATVKRGERDNDLVYRKRLRKPVEAYTRTTPPHVKAARLLPHAEGVIRYLMTVKGPQPIGYVTAAIDYPHYIQKQITPIAKTIGDVVGVDFVAALTGEQWLFKL
jgi:DNA polymerase-2